MSFLFPFLFLCGFSATMVTITGKRFELVLPVSIMCAAIILFFSGLFGTLIPGYYVVYLCAAAAPVILCVKKIMKRDIGSFFASFFTPGFVVFVIVYIFLFVFTYFKTFTVWDEFSHWGPMVKETLRLNQFYSVAESSLMVHKNYPPMVSLIQALWCKLAGGYREGYLYMSLQMTGLSLLFPVLMYVDWKKNFGDFIRLLLISIFIISVPLVILLGGLSFYQSVYIDCLLALTFAYSLLTILLNKKITMFYVCNFSLSLTFLLLVKQIGLYFYVLAIMLFMINHWWLHRGKLHLKLLRGRNITFQSAIKPVAVIFVVVVLPYLTSALWTLFLKGMGGQFNLSDMSITNFFQILFGGGEAYQRTVLINFISAVITRPIVGRPIDLTYIQLCCVSIFVFMILERYGKTIFKKHQMTICNIIVTLGAIAYSFVMLLTYLFGFSEFEGTNLASFDRYLLTYWYAIFVLTFMLFLFITINRFKDKVGCGETYILAALIGMWVILYPTSYLWNIMIPSRNELAAELRSDVTFIEDNTVPDEGVFIVSQGTVGLEQFMFSYYLMPQKINNDYYSIGDDYFDDDVWTKDVTPEIWLEQIAGYEYVYFDKVDDNFISHCGMLFPEDANISEGQLYKITPATGKDKFELVNTKGE
ncbi:hypothetical protein LJC20_04205 [Eubacteriales bacterium OttesenSCG-928-M02]|nr:hypothetical protein [Eubacteriales bacterium OttesenSCG-928-M02]